MTKEIKAINDALKAYYDKHDGKVVINASVFAFNDNGELADDDHIWNSGLLLDQKNNIEIITDEFTKQYNNKNINNMKDYTTHTTLQEFARDIVKLNRTLDIDDAQIGTKEWIGHFHVNAKLDVDPNVSFEECQKAIWNELES